ncbi:hypothetical protein COB21_00685 [Candidatus Aerophobetes bacterium]|uniref:Uncharacterized protein n=1 Tax=Aerophobetes bacterium TaxID=2030807 RepID=A0A2A4X701_UNCAE|nr:MAG: hypothetical protein COB21_00685 [Candidatus Aerophobetes bacterium]
MSMSSMPPVSSYHEAKRFVLNTSRMVLSQATRNIYGSGPIYKVVVEPMIPGSKPVFEALVGAGQKVNTWKKCHELVRGLVCQDEHAYSYSQGETDRVVVWIQKTDSQDLILKTTKEVAKLALLLRYCPASGAFKVIKMDIAVYEKINDEVSLLNLVWNDRVVESSWDNKNEFKGAGGGEACSTHSPDGTGGFAVPIRDPQPQRDLSNRGGVKGDGYVGDGFGDVLNAYEFLQKVEMEEEAQRMQGVEWSEQEMFLRQKQNRIMRQAEQFMQERNSNIIQDPEGDFESNQTREHLAMQEQEERRQVQAPPKACFY